MFRRDSFKLVDKTLLYEDNDQNNGAILLQPYVADKGLDNQIETCKKYSSFINEHGEPCFNKHGQAIYNAVNWLKNGGIIKGCRITAKDATRSNIAICLEVSVKETQKTNAKGEKLYEDKLTGKETNVAQGNTPITQLNAVCGITTNAFKKISDGETAKAQLRSLYKTPASGIAGQYVFPLYLFVCKGRGSYGDSFRPRFIPDNKRDKESLDRNFHLQLLVNENGLSCPYDILKFTNCPESKELDRRSLYLPDVINTNNLPILSYGIDDMYEKAVNLLSDIINNGVEDDDAIIPTRKIDILTFRDENLDIYNNIKIAKDSVDVTRLEGFNLTAGSDGAFALSNPNRHEAIIERFIDFYKGLIDDTILSSQEHKVDLSLDSCQPLEVKKAMIRFLMQRKSDHTLVLDSGTIYTQESLLQFVKDDIKINDKNIKIYPHTFTTYDEFTGRHLRFTTTYILSIIYAKHISEHPEIPLAGIDYPLDKYIDTDSLQPVIKDEYYDALSDAGVNFIHKEQQKYVFASDINTYGVESELLYGNNVLVLNQMVRVLKGLSSEFRFHFSGDNEDFKTLNRIANNKMDQFRGEKAKKIEIAIYKNEQDKSQKRIKTHVKVGFRQFNLANDIEVEIDRL